MNVKRKTLRDLGIYFVIFVVGQLLERLPAEFPVNHISAIFYLVASVGFYYSVERHLQTSMVRNMLLALSIMIMFWFILRAVHCMVFLGDTTASRYIWYAYFIPMNTMLLFMWGASQCLGKQDKKELPRAWFFIKFLSFLIGTLFLTNDFHQLCFRYKPHYEHWQTDYSYGIGFYLSMAWVGILAFWALIQLYKKSNTIVSKELFGYCLIPFLLGALWIALNLLDLTPCLFGQQLVQLPETSCIATACFITCCIDIGLIPSNSEHLELFSRSRISAQIVDQEGNQVYASAYAEPLTKEQLQSKTDIWLDDKYRLCHRDIAGGAIYWKEHVGTIIDYSDKEDS